MYVDGDLSNRRLFERSWITGLFDKPLFVGPAYDAAVSGTHLVGASVPPSALHSMLWATMSILSGASTPQPLADAADRLSSSSRSAPAATNRSAARTLSPSRGRMALMGYGVWALVLGNVLTVATRTIGYIIVARYFCWPSFSFSGLRRIVTFGGQVTAERLLWFIYNQADIFLIGRFLGKELLGYYSVAIHLASLPMFAATQKSSSNS